ncbi:MAG TPA: glycerol kinase GlpK [Caulobacteraceae bacterium]|nr:glycerol kinase GlpK [Caulobacteraceae bacterium]
MILAIDQGTTSTRAIVFDLDWRARAVKQVPLQQHFPRPGWVEHDAGEIWNATLATCRDAIAQAGGEIAGVGLTNQRETTVLWDRSTGEPLHRAIVWQDRRTANVCAALRERGLEPKVQDATGLVLDPYFSASKIAWLLDHVDGARERSARGELCAGTIDSWLMFKLTGGRVHATDVTNASRTSLFGLTSLDWDDALLDLFNVPRSVLPQVKPSAAHFGDTDVDVFGKLLPIMGVAGDQQAALAGHGAIKPGETKITYGTGGFLMSNVGDAPMHSRNRLLGTVGFQTPTGVAYALEGSIFSAGSAVQWLRDGLGLIAASKDSEPLAASLSDNGGVYLVPAFTGLGAPWWNAEARGGVVGLTRDATAAHLARAVLEAIAYQTHDLLEALDADGAPRPPVLKVDGGVTENAWAMQFLADVCDAPVERPAFQEMTALGAARLAALGLGLIERLDVPQDRPPTVWEPRMGASERQSLLAGWRAAVDGVLTVARGAPKPS